MVPRPPRTPLIPSTTLFPSDAAAVEAAVPALARELGGIDRFIANAGIGKGSPVGTGASWVNRATLFTNVLGTHAQCEAAVELDRKSTRLNSSHANISYAAFC